MTPRLTFDAMHATRALAPHDPKLNDIRWMIGESLRRTHQRAQLDSLLASPRSVAALHARDKLRWAEERVGPHAWPIVARIIFEGAAVRDCRGFVPELGVPWRADVIITDRLRCALDAIAEGSDVSPR